MVIKILFFVALIPLYVLLFFKQKRALAVLQQNFYNQNFRYLKWIKNNFLLVILEADVYFPFLVLAINVEPLILTLLFFSYYTLALTNDFRCLKTNFEKKPLVFTPRVKRLLATSFLIYLLPIVFIFFTYKESNLIYYFLTLGFLVYVNYFVLALANYINHPIERLIFKGFLRSAKNKLAKMDHIDVIGITGSYGKTTTKYILNDILSEEFKSFKTPKSFNTENGIVKTINNDLNKLNDFFVVEMGAFKKGEIKKLTKIVNPKYGIITKIGKAHLESFKDELSIKEGKFELFDAIPDDGAVVLNFDDPFQKGHKSKTKANVIYVSLKSKKADVYAENIKYSSDETVFTIKFKKDNSSIIAKTKLLGEFNVYNILYSVALANHLDVSNKGIERAIKKLKPAENRLEVKKFNDINLIDNSYNSNPIGSSNALEVLKMQNGKKIVMTPGMIELGVKQYEENHKFGKKMSEVADYVILVGPKQTRAIFDGLMVSEYDVDKIFVVQDIKEAFKKLNEIKDDETYVLIENDLPDIFNEKKV